MSTLGDLNEILTKGLKIRSFDHWRSVELSGAQGILRNPNLYKFNLNVDYVLVIPSVEVRVSFEGPVQPTSSPVVANGSAGGHVKTSTVSWVASKSVPDSVLPAPISIIWAWYD